MSKHSPRWRLSHHARFIRCSSHRRQRSPDTPKGKAYVDAKGMTLYTFDKDAGAKSACNGLRRNWLPLMAAADAKASGDWTIVTRDDGSKMWRSRASRSTPSEGH